MFMCCYGNTPRCMDMMNSDHYIWSLQFNNLSTLNSLLQSMFCRMNGIMDIDQKLNHHSIHPDTHKHYHLMFFYGMKFCRQYINYQMVLYSSDIYYHNHNTAYQLYWDIETYYHCIHHHNIFDLSGSKYLCLLLDIQNWYQSNKRIPLKNASHCCHKN